MSRLALWELWSYAQVPLFWWLFRRLARRDISGELVAGALFGLYIEFATEPLWDYHFAITFYKDIPPSVPLGWGVMFALAAFFSEKLFSRLCPGAPADRADRRLLACDVLAGVLIGVPLETMGRNAGVWDYNMGVLGWDWGEVPGLGLPWEALAGYALLMLVGPSFVRHWRRELSIGAADG